MKQHYYALLYALETVHQFAMQYKPVSKSRLLLQDYCDGFIKFLVCPCVVMLLMIEETL